MSKVDLYPQLDSSPASAFVQTGSKSGQKGGADVFVIGGTVGTASVPADYDSANIAYPDALTEVYRYYKAVSLIKTVTIVYTDASKANISSWTIA